MNVFFHRILLLAIFCGWLPALRAEASMIIEWERLNAASTDRKADEEPVPGKNWTDSLTGIRFVWIHGGCFQMGSPPWKEGREHDEGPVHPVCVGDYWLARHEVTQEQWQAIMRVNPSLFQKGETHPLEQASWIDAEVISSSLNERFKGQARFRLPTEAEWEFACRERGEDIDFAGRDDPRRLAWSQENSLNSSHSVGTLRPNRLGLSDMNGNVWEWTQDNYRPDAYAMHPEHNPVIVDEGAFKVIRGGSWKDGTHALRCANRGFERHSAKRSDIGFRLAAVVDMESEDKRPPLFEIPF
ncbi:MAG: SUMF1/EgtB/PvdO family nonheme iron enzyme [Magnetococcales bacterium]|nr:SUMF1/EgtB/PvdO family nonheme iron enzyme [Magnetococcales bacterium]MBF0148914.1 SUMF1/EgtB/PvdO family nonheme iron enzyme [Magnetococcales bacterium]MBF0630113.1 SUMF1/EgtB/PvdO family nonheme iron enzyme [Magnetococcales bacterium]